MACRVGRPASLGNVSVVGQILTPQCVKVARSVIVAVPFDCHYKMPSVANRRAHKMTSDQASGKAKVPIHFKDYPNDAGFADIPETKTPIELHVTGRIPDYVHGSLYRTGPGSYTTPLKNGEIFKIQHW